MTKLAKRNLFEKRLEIFPTEYPEFAGFVDAIHHSYWLFTEYNYNADIQHFKTRLAPHEKEAITRCMLAISQIEVNVKRFWMDIYYIFPKPEVDEVGAVFGDSEQRHLAAYRHLLERMGLVEVFQNIRNIPQLMGRVEYTEKFLKNKTMSHQQAVLATVLFSSFIEHISLFSQFLTINAFNKYRNEFKGINNAIEATSKEEELHGRFGIELFKIIAVEHHELLTDEFYATLEAMAEEAFKAEMDIVDWIFEEGELDFLPKETVKNYIRKRYNTSLTTLGIAPKFEVDMNLYREVEWFDIEVLAPKDNDFFNKRSTDYTKFSKPATGDDLFD